MKRVLIVGLGSIGRRHLGLIQELGGEVALCTRQSLPGIPCFESLEQAVGDHHPDMVLIANATAEHHAALIKLVALGSRAQVLVEKPLFSNSQAPLPMEFQNRVSVAYNLRFHPAVLMLREVLGREEAVSAQFYVGMHLSTWRPGRDYRTTYSASRAQGGGVLRDLSHELDLGLWLFGPWRRLVAHGGHFSNLEIDVEDTVNISWEAERCQKIVTEINYLDRAPRRSILVHTHEHTWEADVLGCRLLCDGEVVQTWTIERNHTYLAQDRAWLDSQREVLCSYSEGMVVVEMIEAIENSLSGQAWILS